MHEPLLERISQLERSLRRWRLACFALAILVVSLLAIGGTFGVLMLLQLPDIRMLEMQRAEMEAERAHGEARHMQSEAMRQQSEQALQAERTARRQAEAALQAERAARQQQDGP